MNTPQRAVVGRDGAHLHVLAQFGDQPVALVEQVVGRLAQARAAAICSFTSAMLRGQAGSTLRDGGLQVLAHAGLQAVELRAGGGEAGRDVAGARQHDLARRRCPRAGWPGRPSHSGTAPAAWPRPCSPGGKPFPAARVAPGARGRARTATATSAASRVRKSSCERVTVVTSTPLPKKPAPVNWPVRGGQFGLLARVALTLALAMLWPVVCSAA